MKIHLISEFLHDFEGGGTSENRLLTLHWQFQQENNSTNQSIYKLYLNCLRWVLIFHHARASFC